LAILTSQTALVLLNTYAPFTCRSHMITETMCHAVWLHGRQCVLWYVVAEW